MYEDSLNSIQRTKILSIQYNVRRFSQFNTTYDFLNSIQRTLHSKLKDQFNTTNTSFEIKRSDKKSLLISIVFYLKKKKKKKKRIWKKCDGEMYFIIGLKLNKNKRKWDPKNVGNNKEMGVCHVSTLLSLNKNIPVW